jgi:hypothetical protein
VDEEHFIGIGIFVEIAGQGFAGSSKSEVYISVNEGRNAALQKIIGRS